MKNGNNKKVRRSKARQQHVDWLKKHRHVWGVVGGWVWTSYRRVEGHTQYIVFLGSVSEGSGAGENVLVRPAYEELGEPKFPAALDGVLTDEERRFLIGVSGRPGGKITDPAPSLEMTKRVAVALGIEPGAVL